MLMQKEFKLSPQNWKASISAHRQKRQTALGVTALSPRGFLSVFPIPTGNSLPQQ